jgi:very-short-patch-repair endonuclease
MSLRRTQEWLIQHNKKMGLADAGRNAVKKKRSGPAKDIGGPKIIAPSASKLSVIEETLVLHLNIAKIRGWVREYQFDPIRKWRADFAWPDLKILVECEGGLREGSRGRHMRTDGYIADLEKYNVATLAGWMVLRFDYGSINNGNAIIMIEHAISARTGNNLSGVALQAHG